jgi:hypothetical protein
MRSNVTSCPSKGGVCGGGRAGADIAFKLKIKKQRGEHTYY